MGGGVNHRFGLDDGILVKNTHVALGGGTAVVVQRVRAAAPVGAARAGRVPERGRARRRARRGRRCRAARQPVAGARRRPWSGSSRAACRSRSRAASRSPTSPRTRRRARIASRSARSRTRRRRSPLHLRITRRDLTPDMRDRGPHPDAAAARAGRLRRSALGGARGLARRRLEARRGAARRRAIASKRDARAATRSPAGPDRLLPAEIARHLTTARFGRRLECFETIDSTNVHAARLAREDAPEGTLVLAERQTRGPRAARPQLGLAGARESLRELRAPPAARAGRRAAARARGRRRGGARARAARARPASPSSGPTIASSTARRSPASSPRWTPRSIAIRTRRARHRRQPERARAGVSRRAARDRHLGAARDRRPRRSAALRRRACAALEDVYDRIVRDGFAVIAPEWESYSCLTGRRGHDRLRRPRGATGTVRGIDATGRSCSTERPARSASWRATSRS